MRWRRPKRSRSGTGDRSSISLIDLHCHLLPGIDDGPATMHGTLAMARAAVQAGTRVVVATPHVSAAYPGNTAALIRSKVQEARAALAEAKIELDVVPGAEVELARAMRSDEAELRALRLGAGPWLLVECPLVVYDCDEATTAMRSISARGHRVVLAHPERSPAFQRDPNALDELVRDGMRTCITAGALNGRFGESVRLFAVALVRAGLAHVVASDAHDATQRPPTLRRQVEAAGLADQIPLLAAAMPEAILARAPTRSASRQDARG